MLLYLAGPMRGLPKYNYPLFHAVTAELETAGHEVFNPARETIKFLGFDPSERSANGRDEESGVYTREIILQDLTFICLRAQGIVFLPGAMFSSGASAEYATGKAISTPDHPCQFFDYHSARDRITLGLKPLVLCECP